MSPGARPPTRIGGWDCCAHHAMVLALGPQVAEPGPLEDAPRGAVEKRGRDPLPRRLLRIALHHATARLRDQVESTAKRHACDAFPSIVPVDEETGEAIVGQLLGPGRLVFLQVEDARKLLRRPVLAPGHRGIAVEDQGRVSLTLADETLFPGAAFKPRSTEWPGLIRPMRSRK